MAKDGFERYADMLHMEHPTSKTRARMSLYDRAAQFSPFAALTGHEDAIAETARLTDVQTELDESRKENINRQLQILLLHINNTPEIMVTWFEDDGKKAGGAYRCTHGILKKYEETTQEIWVDCQQIPVDRIRSIEAAILEED